MSITRAILGLGLFVAGCSVGGPTPLAPSEFVRSGPVPPPGEHSRPVQENGSLVYGQFHVPLLPNEYTNPNPRGPVPISPVVQKVAPPAATNPVVQVATTAPATQPAALPIGEYQIVGLKIAEVNGEAIFADKVLAAIEHQLAADARRLDPDTFRRAARSAIEAKVQEMIDNRIWVATADKSLSQDDKTEADLRAMLWRRQQIAQAGGSEAAARKRALESGTSFDEQVQQIRDHFLVWIYIQRHEVPRIHITFADMKGYYDAHLDSEFTQHAAARFRLIKIDMARSGGAEQAVAKANRIIDELRHGADFAALARKYNDDPLLMKTAGDVGWVNKGEFALEPIEQAVWTLHPREFTEVPIKVVRGEETAYYIAFLEDRKPGARRQFDADVQELIREKLRSAQLREIQQKEQEELHQNAALFVQPQDIDKATDMAMQLYPLWASAR